tara:strand:- start:778 stop:993 length:216 start_codon:yes stop_codon:yes gene_type:complete
MTKNKDYIECTGDSDKLQDWVDYHDGCNPIDYLRAILNGEIKTEVMIDSILSFKHEDKSVSEEYFKEMWRK